MTLCGPCSRGNHPHDRHTGKVPGTLAGQDAGCPMLEEPRDDGAHRRACACAVVLPPTGQAARSTRHCPTCTCGGGER